MQRSTRGRRSTPNFEHFFPQRVERHVNQAASAAASQPAITALPETRALLWESARPSSSATHARAAHTQRAHTQHTQHTHTSTQQARSRTASASSMLWSGGSGGRRRRSHLGGDDEPQRIARVGARADVRAGDVGPAFRSAEVDIVAHDLR